MNDRTRHRVLHRWTRRGPGARGELLAALLCSLMLGGCSTSKGDDPSESSASPVGSGTARPRTAERPTDTARPLESSARAADILRTLRELHDEGGAEHATLLFPREHTHFAQITTAADGPKIKPSVTRPARPGSRYAAPLYPTTASGETEIRELDINPIIAYPESSDKKGVLIVDGRVSL